MELAADSQFWGLLFIFISILASSFFSGAETAITAFGQLRAQHVVEQLGEKGCRHVKLWINHPSRVITTILIFNNVFNISASAQATVIASRYFENNAVGVATGIITFLVLIFGEIVPKSFARAHADQLAQPALRVILVLNVIFYPVVYLLSEFTNSVLRLLGSPTDLGMPVVTEDELEFIISQSKNSTAIEQTKKEMISGVFEFDETRVREVMTPRTDIVALKSSDSFEEAVRVVLESGHSRLPIYDERIDNIVGMLFAKDLLIHSHADPQDRPSLKQLMRTPMFVPESNQLMEVFKELKRTKNHFTVIIDEYGGTAGIVTLEDILEEIVGEIQDEFDSEESDFQELEPDRFLVMGSVSIHDFMDYFQLDDSFETKVDGDVDTIAGWVTKLLGDLPEQGQTVTHGFLTIEVIEVDRHRIGKVRVSRAKEVAPPQEVAQGGGSL